MYNIIDHAYKDRDASFEYDDRGYLVRAIYAKKEEQFRTPDKLGNLYETKDKKDRKYKNSQLQEDRTYYYHYDVEGNLIFKEHIKDIGYRPVFSGGELRDLGINPKSPSLARACSSCLLYQELVAYHLGTPIIALDSKGMRSFLYQG